MSSHSIEFFGLMKDLTSGRKLLNEVDDSTADSKTMDERATVAEACVLGLDLAMPTVLDDMDNSTDAAYAALPERLYVIDEEGRAADVIPER